MKNLRSIITLLPLCILLTACYVSEHFVDDAQKLDGIYFGKGPSFATASVVVKGEETWRNYYLFGLIPSRKTTEQFVGLQLANTGATLMTGLEIQTTKSGMNVLGEIGFALIPFLGLTQPLFVNFRKASYQYQARKL